MLRCAHHLVWYAQVPPGTGGWSDRAFAFSVPRSQSRASLRMRPCADRSGLRARLPWRAAWRWARPCSARRPRPARAPQPGRVARARAAAPAAWRQRVRTAAVAWPSRRTAHVCPSLQEAPPLCSMPSMLWLHCSSRCCDGRMRAVASIMQAHSSVPICGMHACKCARAYAPKLCHRSLCMAAHRHMPQAIDCSCGLNLPL